MPKKDFEGRIVKVSTQINVLMFFYLLACIMKYLINIYILPKKRLKIHN